MSAPLSDAELQRGLAVLLSREGGDWLFPAGMTAANEEGRIFRAHELLTIEFGRCEVRRRMIDEDDTYSFSPQSGSLVAGPRRGKSVSLGVLVCTFGIATAWPGRQPSRLARAIPRRLIAPMSTPWVPGWWDEASPEVEQALIRAAVSLEHAGYEYVPDPVFDEPYDGRFAHAVPRPGGSHWVNPELRWAGRYFEYDARSLDGGAASHSRSQ